MFITSTFTAAVTKVMATHAFVARVRNESDLTGTRVAVVRGTYETIARDFGARLTFAETSRQAVEAVLAGRAEACLMTEVLLKYTAAQSFRDRISVIPLSRRKTFYAFGLPANSALRERINLSLLQIANSPAHDEILHAYLDY